MRNATIHQSLFAATLEAMPSSVAAFAAFDKSSPLGPLTITRRDPGPKDVQIDILYCGVCHSDLHTVRNEWGGRRLPCVPGHEILGRVTAVGAEVTQVQGRRHRRRRLPRGLVPRVRQLQGRPRAVLRHGGTVFTYGAPDANMPGQMTYGGYSTSITVTEDFVLSVSETLDPAACRAAAVRRHHHLLAAAALGCRPRQEGRHRRPRRPGPHGRQVRARARRRDRPVHDVGRARSPMACASAPMRSSSRRTPTRCSSTPAASTSSSTPCRPRTTSISSRTCSSATARWCCSGPPSTRTRHRT